MESTNEAERQLAELRRAEVLTHTRYPRSDRWGPPFAGVVAAGYTAMFAMSGWGRTVSQLALVALVLVGVNRYQHRRGTWPRMWSAPAALRAEYVRYCVGYLVLLAALAALWRVAPWWLVSLVAGGSAAAGWEVFDRRYARAAARAERALEDNEPR